MCNNLNGILLVNKQKGYSSYKVVSELKKIFNIKKIGHVGTLDPLASGLLMICLGKATKLSNYFMNEKKIYRATVLLGQKTSTADLEGEIEEQKYINYDEFIIIKQKIENTIKSFLGSYNQRIPLYSATKYNGKKMYEYARKNIYVKTLTKNVNIYDINFLDKSLKYENGKIFFSFDVCCGKGTYIRTLCEDIGLRLNVPSLMQNLLRINIGKYNIQNSYTLQYIKKNKKNIIIDINKIKFNIKEIILDTNICKELLLGKKFYKYFYNKKINGKFFVRDNNGKLIALYENINCKENYKNLITFNF